MIPSAIICRNEKLSENLRRQTFDVAEISPYEPLGDSTSQHTDLQIFAHGTKIIAHKNIKQSDVRRLEKFSDIEISRTEISSGYPNDAPFNACFTGKYLIHNMPICAPEIKKYCGLMGAETIDVRQGYARCTTIPVSPDAIITCDAAIASKCAKHLKVLLVRPGHIFLEGYKYGFIGGACGVHLDTVYFNGDIRLHPDFDLMESFMKANGKKYITLTGGICIDTGSIFFIG